MTGPDELQRHVDHLEDLLAGIEVLAARRSTTRPAGVDEAPVTVTPELEAWREANYDALHGRARSKADARYSEIIAGIEAIDPGLNDHLIELDEMVGERLCEAIDHAVTAAWALLVVRGRTW